MDQVTGAIYTNTFTVPALSGILGGNLGYVGFTGATGGSFATHTVGSFTFNNYSQQARTLSNNINVGASATGGLDVAQAGPGAASSAALTGVLTLSAGSILKVTGGATATDTPYLLDVTGSTTLAGNSTIDVANNGTGLGTLHLDDVNQSGGNRSLTKTGAGTLVLSGALSFAVLNTNEGTTNLNSALANATINDNGGKLNINASQTLVALNIGDGGTVVLESSPGALPGFGFYPGNDGAAFGADGATVTGASVQAVPEPGSIGLLFAGIASLLGRRRKKNARNQKKCFGFLNNYSIIRKPPPVSPPIYFMITLEPTKQTNSFRRRFGKVGALAAALTFASAQFGQATVVDTASLSIAPSGKLDVKNNALIVRNGSLPAITGYLTTGINSATGWWDGPGIDSSTAALTISDFTRGVGVLLNDFEGSPFYPTFKGVSVNITDVLSSFTWMGDADVDGIITASDQFFLDNGIALGLTGWQNGDFDYDGALTASDQFYIDNSLALGGGSPGPAPGAAPSAVPEPASFALLALGFFGFASRRRRS